MNALSILRLKLTGKLVSSVRLWDHLLVGLGQTQLHTVLSALDGYDLFLLISLVPGSCDFLQC